MLVSRMNFPVLTASFFLFIYFLFPLSAFPAHAKGIKPSGNLELQDGQEISFAGLIIPVESFSLLSVIISGKELELELERSENYRSAQGLKAAYFYVQTFEMDFPFQPESKPRQTKVMVNELLVSMGLARVDAENSFKHREKFLEIQKEAKSRGMGIWSYETPALQPQ